MLFYFVKISVLICDHSYSTHSVISQVLLFFFSSYLSFFFLSFFFKIDSQCVFRPNWFGHGFQYSQILGTAQIPGPIQFGGQVNFIVLAFPFFFDLVWRFHQLGQHDGVRAFHGTQIVQSRTRRRRWRSILRTHT